MAALGINSTAIPKGGGGGVGKPSKKRNPPGAGGAGGSDLLRRTAPKRTASSEPKVYADGAVSDDNSVSEPDVGSEGCEWLHDEQDDDDDYP